MTKSQKIAVVGAGPVGSLAALYAAQRGYEVEVYELRPGEILILFETTTQRLHLFLATQLICAATDFHQLGAIFWHFGVRFPRSQP